MNRPISLHLNEHYLRKEGDSNPRYENSHGSLANCWFQPLTHPSFRWLVSVLPSIVLKCGAKVWTFSDIAKFFSLFFDFMIEFWQLKSQPASATFRIILAKLQHRCCEVQFFPWSPVDFNLELSSANLRAIARQIRSLCLAMLSHAGGMSSLYMVLASGMTCAFSWWGSSCCILPYVSSIWAPWRKTEKLRLWSIGLTENKKKKARPTARKIVKQKKNTRRPRAKIVKQKKNARLPWKKKHFLTNKNFFHGRNK